MRVEGTIRVEEPTDVRAIADVLADAFDGVAEMTLVERLRTEHREEYGPSLVAEIDGVVVGHALLTSVTVVAADDEARALFALAPVAVLRTCQRLGIGSNLVNAALVLADRPVVVLGDREWYTRFGFEPATRWGIGSRWAEAGDAWQVWFPEGSDPAEWAGEVRYPAPFERL